MYFSVMSGGGTLLYYLLGSYFFFYENDIEFKGRVGTSAGAIVQALASIYKQPKAIMQVVNSLDLAKMKDFNLDFGNYTGILNGDLILEAFKKFFDIQFKDIEDNLNVIATRVKDGKETVFNKQNTPNIYLYDALRASMSIAGAFKPHEIQGDQYIDGGYTNNCAFDFFDNNPYTITVKLINSRENFEIKNILDSAIIPLYISIRAIEKKHSEDNYKGKVIKIDTDKSFLKFDMSKDDIQGMILDGFEQTKKQWEL